MPRTANLLRNEKQFLHMLIHSTGKHERSVRKVFCLEIWASVNTKAGNFFAVENFGVEDGGYGDSGKAFW